MTDNLPATVRAYKGFNPDLTCRGFQYVEGKTYETDRAELCRTGFHACPLPLDTLRYYPLASSVYREVEVAADAEGDGDKIASRTIKIGTKISLTGMIRAHIDLLWQRIEPKRDESTAATSGYQSTAATSGDESTAATSGYQSTAATSGYESTAATSGYQSTAATSGNQSTAATSGYQSTAATSGYQSTAATSGNQSTAATSGDQSTVIVEGEQSIALAGGTDCKARGSDTCWLVLVERDEDGHILCVRAVAVGSETDGITIESDTYYALRDGRVVLA